MGVVYERSDEPAKAEAEYRLAIQYNPKDNLSYDNLGSLYHKQGRNEEAVTALEAALRLKPADIVALYNLGSIHLDAGYPDKAIHLLRKAVSLDPGLLFGHNNLALAYSRAGKPEKAFAQYRKITEIPGADSSARGQAWYRMAQLRAAQRRTQEAQNCLAEAIMAGGASMRGLAAGDPLLRGLHIIDRR